MTDQIEDILIFFREETRCIETLIPDTDLVAMTCAHEDEFVPILTAFSDRFAVSLHQMDMWFHIYPELRHGPHVRPYIPLTARILAEAVAVGEWHLSYPQPPDGGWQEGRKGWGLLGMVGIAGLIAFLWWIVG